MVALASGLSLDYDKLKVFTRKIAELFVSKYGDKHRLPVSVHKLLLHGAETVKNRILPIGQMSEEAQESSNKIYRRVREYHSRKDSFHHTTEDVIQSMIVRSDPLISNIRSQILRSYQKTEKQELPIEVLELVSTTNDDDQDEEDEEVENEEVLALPLS